MRHTAFALAAVAGLLAGVDSAAAQCVSINEDESREIPGGFERIVGIVNGCSYPITWRICVVVDGRPAADYSTGTTAAGSRSRYVILLNEQHFRLSPEGPSIPALPRSTYDVTVCRGTGCVPREPSCRRF